MASYSKLRVLFVDDEDFIREWAVMSLDEYDVVTVPSADHALAEIAANGAPAFLVCDNSLPGMNGIDLARQIREEHPDVVRILFTGAPGTAAVREAQADGLFADVLDKPVGTLKLRARLLELMAHFEGQKPG